MSSPAGRGCPRCFPICSATASACRDAKSSMWARRSTTIAIGGSISPTSRTRTLTPPPMGSEEHTSELQSLMRISYAVFCLKKKKQNYLVNAQTHNNEDDH